MNITILSGKGGTGKTTVATNLAKLLNFNYIDLDVEEPNGYIFLDPVFEKTKNAKVLVPEIDLEKCRNCGRCAQTCQFNALVKMKNSVMVFEELCHGCGACSIVCPEDAISEKERIIGVINIGTYNNRNIFIQGVLDLNEPIAIPVIKKAKSVVSKNENNIFDSPPGTSCSMIEAVEESDFAVLVTEPTAFGLHDLQMAIAVLESIKVPYGVVINRSIEADDYLIVDFLNEHNITLLGKIPYSKRAAEIYSKGNLLIECLKFKQYFFNISEEILDRVRKI